MHAPDLTQMPVSRTGAARRSTRSGCKWPVRPATLARRSSTEAITPTSLSNVPADLMNQITRQLATAGHPLEAVCKSVVSWCHSATATNCGPNDAMFRSLLVLFGLPSEWLDKTFPNGKSPRPVVPDEPAPFSSFFILWITLCKAFNGTTFWLQHGAIDAHSHERRRLGNSQGPRDPFQIRDVLLDPASGVRVRAYACAVLNNWMARYPEPQGGTYRVPPALPASGSASERSSRVNYEIRMQNVAMHWLMKPAATLAHYEFRKAPTLSTSALPWNMDELWRGADRALSALLSDDGWLVDGRLQDKMTYSGDFPKLCGYVPYETYEEYMSDPVQLADYLIKKLDATLSADLTRGMTTAASRFYTEMEHDRLKDEMEHGVPTADLEGTTLMRVFDMVVDANIRGRRIWTLAQGSTLGYLCWLTVLQSIKVAVMSTAPESFPGAGDAFCGMVWGNPSNRPLDEQIVDDIRILVKACPDKAHLSDITFDSIQNELARKYSGDDDPRGAARAAAANAILLNEDRIKAALHPLSKQKALQYWPADDEDTIQALSYVVDALWTNHQSGVRITHGRIEQQALDNAPKALKIPLEMFPDELGTIVRKVVRQSLESRE